MVRRSNVAPVRGFDTVRFTKFPNTTDACTGMLPFTNSCNTSAKFAMRAAELQANKDSTVDVPKSGPDFSAKSKRALRNTSMRPCCCETHMVRPSRSRSSSLAVFSSENSEIAVGGRGSKRKAVQDSSGHGVLFDMGTTAEQGIFPRDVLVCANGSTL